MIVLGLDLGTKTGYAVGHTQAKTLTRCGTYQLATPKELREQAKVGGERRHDIRYQRLYAFIVEMIETHGVNRIVFEDVQFASTTMQAHLWGALRAAVWHISVYTKNVDIQCVPVGTLKKFATDDGSADKDQMLAALKTHPIYRKSKEYDLTSQKLDDNAVDAVWLFLYAKMMDTTQRPWTSVWDRREQAKTEKKERAKKKKMKSLLRQAVENEVLNG